SRTRQPARRQRLGECGLGAALLLAVLSLGPSWLVLPWSFSDGQGTPAVAPSPPPVEVVAAVPPREGSRQADVLAGLPPPDGLPWKPEAADGPEGVPLPSQPQEGAPAFPLEALGWFFLAVYAFCSALLLARWLLGYVAPARLLRATEAPPEAVARLFG